MSVLTSNYNLIKPQAADPIDLLMTNPNWDIIDEKLQEAANSGGTRVVVQSKEPTDTSVLWIDTDDNTTDDAISNKTDDKFIINITFDEEGNLLADKTYTEVYAAYEEGKELVAHIVDLGLDIPYMMFTDGMFGFSASPITINEDGQMVSTVMIMYSADNLGWETAESIIPTRVSQLENDTEYVTKEYVDSLVESALGAIAASLAEI